MKTDFDLTTWLMFVLIGLIIITGLFTMYNLKKETTKCIFNPIQYGIVHINEEATCTCSAPNVNPITYNANGIVQLIPQGLNFPS
jgi:hypothetical protein